MGDDIVYGWHFLRVGGTAIYGYRPPAVGEWEPPVDDPMPCVRGYHGSPTILAALDYAGGPILGRCEYRGVVHDPDATKWAARERRCIARADATALLRVFAARAAEIALAAVGETDERALNAPRVARRHALGLATDAELASARASARASAWASARASASEWAWASARASASEWAWASARASAWASARASAWASARASASEWAWASARADLSAWLESAALDLDTAPALEVTP